MTYNGNVSRDGFWINWETGRVFPIDEHQRWMRRENNAALLGVPEGVIRQFPVFPYENGDAEARKRFLMFLFANAPVMRVRGHDTMVTFEFAAPVAAAPQVLRAVKAFSRDYGTGERMCLHIVNFQERGSLDMTLPELRAATSTRARTAKLAWTPFISPTE